MLVRENIGRDMLRLIVWYPVRYVLMVLPVKLGFSVLRKMGDLHYAASRGKQSVIARNLTLAFENRLRGRGLDDAVRDYLRNHYVNQLQILLFPKLDRRNLGGIHTFEGLEHLDRAIQGGRGCILLHPHYGPPQMPLCALGILGYPVMQLGLLTDEGTSYIGRNVAFRMRQKYESLIPARIISAESFLRPLILWLKENKVLLMTGDGAGGGRFIGKYAPLPFLGKDTLFPLGAGRLAKKTGAPVLPMVTLLTDAGTYRTIIHEPIVGADPADYARQFVRIFESYVEKRPGLWHFWDEFDSRMAGHENPKEEVLR